MGRHLGPDDGNGKVYIRYKATQPHLLSRVLDKDGSGTSFIIHRYEIYYLATPGHRTPYSSATLADRLFFRCKRNRVELCHHHDDER